MYDNISNMRDNGDIDVPDVVCRKSC